MKDSDHLALAISASILADGTPFTGGKRTVFKLQAMRELNKAYRLALTAAADHLKASAIWPERTALLEAARSIADASWAKFMSMIDYKAERAGGHFIKVNPKHTSQRCSGCGELVPKTLAVRTHSCSSCGLVMDRDWNAAKNILHAAVLGDGFDNVARWGERRTGKLALVSK